jgi:hypothetical protein
MKRFRYALVLLLFASGASAQTSVFDHLQCFPLKDALRSTPLHADLEPEQAPPFALAPGCRVKFPAKFLCVDVAKTNVQPPGTTLPIGGDTTRDFLCYAVRCPTPAAGLPTLTVSDQFGERTVRVRPSKYLCAPAINGPAPRPTSRPCADLGGGQCSDTCDGGDECLFVPQGFELVGVPAFPDIVGTDDCRCVPSSLRCDALPAAVCTVTGGDGGLCTDASDQCAATGGACACQPAAGGGPCGSTTCPPGTVCCNPLDGICTPPGEACTL